SPLPTAGWTHATAPVTHGQHTELWHSRLGTEVGGVVVELDGEPLRALWTPGYKVFSFGSFHLDPPWSGPMNSSDRFNIVSLTSDWGLTTKAGAKYVPQPSLA